MPTKKVLMMPALLGSGLAIGICIFFVVVLIGGLDGFLDTTVIYVLCSITLIAIVTALVLSYRAFARVVKGDNEAAERYPAWDKAMATWNSLYYCSRDNVVFDPKAQKTLSDKQLAVLRSMDENSVESKAATMLAHQS